MFSKIKAWIMNKYLQSFARNIGTRVVKWLAILGIAPDVANVWWATTTLIIVELAEYLLAQYLSVKATDKK